MMDVNAVLAAAKVPQDDDGKPVVVLATCGNCGRTWNDEACSSITPTPAARCPWEMDDELPCWEVNA